jgi:hypothetical protein
MLVYQISLTIAEIIIICGVVFATQLYIAKILLQNVNTRISELDTTLAEAIQSVVQANLGEFQQQNPLVGIITDIMKQNMAKNNESSRSIVEIPRADDEKFKIKNKDT